MEFVALIAFLILVVSTIAVFFKRWRPKAKIVAPASLVVLTAAAVIGGNEGNNRAKSLGFVDAADHRAAVAAGVPDPNAWKAKRDEVAAAKAVEQARLAAEKAAEEARQAAEKASAEARRAELLKQPADQIAFIAAAIKGREQYKAGSNDLQKGAARPARSKAICAALASTKIDGWIGTLQELTTNGDGKGVIEVSIADNLTLKTWNNAVSDIGTDTLIDPNSALYKKLLTLKEGGYVRVSGRFFSSPTDCVREASITIDGSMRSPDFIVRFSKVEHVELPK